MACLMRSLLLPLFLTLAACSGIPGDPHAKMCLEGFEAYPEHAEAVQAAAEEWGTATNGGIAPTLVMGCSADMVRIEAHRNYHDVDEGKLVGGETDNMGKWIALNVDYSGQAFKLAALHELGHFFTGPDHSDYDMDVMYWTVSPNRQTGLTRADAGRFQHD